MVCGGLLPSRCRHNRPVIILKQSEHSTSGRHSSGHNLCISRGTKSSASCESARSNGHLREVEVPHETDAGGEIGNMKNMKRNRMSRKYSLIASVSIATVWGTAANAQELAFEVLTSAPVKAADCMVCEISCGEGGGAFLVETYQRDGCPAVGEDFQYEAGPEFLGLCQPVASSAEVAEEKGCICDRPPCEVRKPMPRREEPF